MTASIIPSDKRCTPPTTFLALTYLLGRTKPFNLDDKEQTNSANLAPRVLRGAATWRI